MSWQRGAIESLQLWRDRVSRQWLAAVGPLPPKKRTKGREVPLTVAQLTGMADSLDELDELLGEEPAFIEEIDDGRVIWFESVNRKLGPEDRVLPALSPDAYERIVESLEKQAMYRLYLRTVSGEAIGEEEFKEGYVQGEDRGANISAYWRPFALMGRRARLRGSYITRGRLESISVKLAREQTKGYVAGWFLALVRTLPEDNEWLSMKDGETNCVVALIRNYLRAKGRGGLTTAREKVLEAFQRRVGEAGADHHDMQWLCTQLRWRIELRGLEGELLWYPINRQGEPAYAGGKQQAPLVIYRGNGHAFPKQPIMPKPKSISVYYDEVVSAKGESFAAFERRRDAILARVIRRNKLLRGYVVGSEVVDDDGTVHRPLSCDKELCELNGVCGDDSDYNVGPDGERLEVLHVGGAQSYRFKLWRASMGIETLPPNVFIRCAWRKASFEAVPWCAADANDLAEGQGWDMRAAYLACGHGGIGAGRAWAERCGFPAGGKQLRATVSDLSEVEKLAGCVRFRELVLADHCPASIRQQLAYHVTKGEGDAWLPIPMALYLRDTGLLQEHRLEQVLYSVRRLDDLCFPERNVAVRFIGSCSYHAARQTLWTKDAAEAGFYDAKYEDKNVEVTRIPGDEASDEDLYKIAFDTKKMRKDHSFVRAYVLGYMFIGMAEAIRAIPEEELLACKVDCFVLRKGAGFPNGIPSAKEEDKPYVPPGTFLPKKASEQRRTESLELPARFEPGEDIPTEGLSADSIHSLPLVFLDGQGGAGKTWRALRAFPGRRVVVLGKDNEHLVDLSTIEKNPYKYPAKTYHEYFHLGVGKWEDWNPETMGRLRPDVVVWDEFAHVHPGFLRASVVWLRSVGAQVVLCGDPTGQLPPYDPNSDVDLSLETLETLESLGAHVEFMATDYRAKDCPELQDMKRRAWRVENEKQLAVLQELEYTPIEEVMKSWSPSDTIVVTTNSLGEQLGAKVEEARQARFAGEPVRMRFRPKDRKPWMKKGGVLPMVLTPDGRPVSAVIGQRQEVPAEAASNAEGLWKIDSWTTVHSVQGRTIPAPGRLIIVTDGMEKHWCRNAAYTALSRAEKKSQLVRTSLYG